MKIGKRGQITLPKYLRDRYRLYPGMEIDLVEDHDQIILRRVGDILKHDAWANIVGMLKDTVHDVDIDIEEMRGCSRYSRSKHLDPKQR